MTTSTPHHIVRRDSRYYGADEALTSTARQAERFDNAVRKMFTVPKTDFLREEAKWKQMRAKKRRAKKSSAL